METKNPNPIANVKFGNANMDGLRYKEKGDDVQNTNNLFYGSPIYCVSSLSCTNEAYASSNQALPLSIPSVTENVSPSPVIPLSDSDNGSTNDVISILVPLSVDESLYGANCLESHNDLSIGCNVSNNVSVPELDMEHSMNSVLFHEDGCRPFCENQSVSKPSSEESICISIPSKAPEYYIKKGARQLSKAANEFKKTRSRPFEPRALRILKNWVNSHLLYPYCSKREKTVLSNETGLSVKQITIWFCNYRCRVWNKRRRVAL